MNRFALVTDSSASLTPGELAHPDIYQVEIVVMADGKTVSNRQELYQAFEHRHRVSTAAPGVAVFEKLYRELLEKGYTHIFSLHMSGALSSTAQNAQVAAQLFDGTVSSFDTRTAGFAQGRFVLDILALIEAGKPRAEIWNRIENYRVDEVFLFPRTVEHLKQGGRVKAGAAVVAQLFQIVPYGRIADGRLLYAGRAKSYSDALATVLEREQVSAGRRVLVQADDAQLPEELADLANGQDLALHDIPLALLAHTGPGACALILEP